MENEDFSMVDKNVASSTISHPSLAYASTGASSCNDDLSIFLHQILRSSLSSAIAFSGEQPAFSFSSSSPSRISGTTSNNMASTEVNRHSSPPALAGGNISAITSSIGDFPPSSIVKRFGICNGPKADNSVSFLFGANESDPDQDDCESEDPKRFMGELPVKSIKCRSSKRSRAAEVHNLSEKRRRSKINEKMKALQNLIPNSNKTDKASMLEEAIEYLKQLQLKVQMLTFRNGLRLPRAGAEQLPNTIIDFGEIREPLHLAMPDKSQLDQDRPPNTLFNLPVACANLTDLLCPHVDGSNSEKSPGIDHSTKVHAASFYQQPFARGNGEDTSPLGKFYGDLGEIVIAEPFFGTWNRRNSKYSREGHIFLSKCLSY